MSGTNPFSKANAPEHNLVSKIVGSGPFHVAVDLVDIDTAYAFQLGSAVDPVDQAYIKQIGTPANPVDIEYVTKVGTYVNPVSEIDVTQLYATTIGSPMFPTTNIYTTNLGTTADPVTQSYISEIGDSGVSGNAFFNVATIGTLNCSNIIPAPGGGSGGIHYQAGTGIGITYTSATNGIINSLVRGSTGIGVTLGPGNYWDLTNLGVLGITGAGGISVVSGDTYTIQNTGVLSVTGGTGIAVDNTDPQNPKIFSTSQSGVTGISGGTGIQILNGNTQFPTIFTNNIQNISAGSNITIDFTNPLIPSISASGGGTGSIPNGPVGELLRFGVSGVTSDSNLTYNGSEMVIPTTQVISPGQLGRMRLANIGDTSYIQSGLRSVIGDGNILAIAPFSSGSSIAQFDTQNAKVSLGGALNVDPTSQKIQVSGNTVITGTNGPGQYGTTFQTFTTAGTTTLPGITGTVYNIYAWGEGGTGQGAQAGGEIEILGLTAGNITWSFAGGGGSVSGNTGGNALYVNVLGVTGVAYGGGGGGGVTGAGGNATAVTGGSGGVSSQTTVEQLSFAKTGDVLSNITIVGTSTFQTSGFLTIPAGATLTASAEHIGSTGGSTFDILTFPEGTTFSIEGSGVTGFGLFTSGVTAIYSPYSNLNVGVAGVSASGVTGNGQQIVDGTTGISGSNVEFFNSSGISDTTSVSMSGTVQSAFSGSGPVYIYIENPYSHTPGTNLYPIITNCQYALVASANATPTPISASFSTTSQTSTVLPTYTTTAGTEIRTVSSIISVRGISGTTLGGAGDFGGGGGGYFGGGGGIVGGAGGNGSSFITGITGAAANNGSGTDGYRNRYNDYVNGGAQQPGAIVIETVNTSNVTPTLTVNGTISAINYEGTNSGDGFRASFLQGLVSNNVQISGVGGSKLSLGDDATPGGEIVGITGGGGHVSVNFPAGITVLTNGGYALTVNGGSTFSADAYGSDFIIRSDSRLKENIVTVDSALDKVMKLRGVYFNKSDDPTRRIGVIAQEVEQVLPEVVHTDDSPEQMKAVSYANIIGLLIEAVKEQQEMIKKLM